MGADVHEPEGVVLLEPDRNERGVEGGDADKDGQNPTAHDGLA